MNRLVTPFFAFMLALLAACSADRSAPVASDSLALPASKVSASAALPGKAGMCTACHGLQGWSSLPAHPHLAGQNREYLISAMRQYRSGQRQHAAMQAVMGPLTESDIEALATYYAAQSRPLPEQAAQ